MGPNELALFSPQNGGLGAYLSCTGTTGRVALPAPTTGTTFQINNLGTDIVFLAFGDVTIEATTSYLAVPPGLLYLGIPNARGSGAPTYMAGITTGATVPVQISAGSLTVV